MRACNLGNSFTTFPLPSLGHQTAGFVHVFTCWGTRPVRCWGCISHGGPQGGAGAVKNWWWLRTRTGNGTFTHQPDGEPLLLLRIKAPWHWCKPGLCNGLLILKVEGRRNLIYPFSHNQMGKAPSLKNSGTSFIISV